MHLSRVLEAMGGAAVWPMMTRSTYSMR
jgi:hypothetical protein